MHLESTPNTVEQNSNADIDIQEPNDNSGQNQVSITTERRNLVLFLFIMLCLYYGLTRHFEGLPSLEELFRTIQVIIRIIRLVLDSLE